MSSIDQVTLTTGMQQNLVALQNTQTLINQTQQRLSTGKAVNSALDNPIDFFESQSLNNRASDLASYGDGMSNAIQTIQAANQGVTSITSLINAAKGIAASALNAGNSTTASGNTYQTDTLTFNNMAAGDAITIGGSTFTAVAATTAAIGNTQFRVGSSDAQTAQNFVATIGVSLGAAATNIGAVADNITVNSANGNVVTLTSGATNITSGMITSSSSMIGTITPGGGSANSQLTSLVNQYNSILSQIDGMAADSSYQGTSLLNNTSATALVVNFGNNHSLSIAGFDATSSGLGLTAAQNGWTSSTAVNNDTAKLDTALTTLQSQSSTLSTNLSTIQARQNFSTQLENVLTTGANNLTLADTNEEGANMLMLQTQQSLGTTALSLASQSAQSVLRLFG